MQHRQKVDLYEIANINANLPGLIKENDNSLASSYESSSEHNYTFSLENSLNINSPIFQYIEKGNINYTTEEEKSPTDEQNLYLIENINKLKKSFRNLFISSIYTKKKRGREKQKQDDTNENENEDNHNIIKIHDKNTSDNLLRKVQVHYLTFIVQILNEILSHLNYKQRFLNLSYEFKRNIKKDFVNSLKNKTIGEIICTPISNKYKKELDYNRNIYDQIKEDRLLSQIFSENYLLLFRKIYFKSERILRGYGLNKRIILSDKVKMYKDLLKKINSSDEYEKNIKNCVNRNFFHKSLFTTE